MIFILKIRENIYFLFSVKNEMLLYSWKACISNMVQNFLVFFFNK